jgi:hypothetical protein
MMGMFTKNRIIAFLILAAIAGGFGYKKYKEPPKPTQEQKWQSLINFGIEEEVCSLITKDIDRFKDSPQSFRRMSLNALIEKSILIVKSGVNTFSNITDIPSDFPVNYMPRESREKRPFPLCRFDYEAWIKLPALVPDENTILHADKNGSNSPTLLPTFKTTDLHSPIHSTNSNKRLALVIGNAAYRNKPLANPKNDADDMSTVLKKFGFEVIDLRDASLIEMRRGVREFGDRLINYDVGLVYYSGHGVEVKGRNFFLPISEDIKHEDEVADQALDANLILEKMASANKNVNILIVDACRNNNLASKYRSKTNGLAAMEAPKGTIVAFSTSPGKVAEDGNARNSPYTKYLIKEMLVPNRPIESVFKATRRGVLEETRGRQTPWENTSLSGDFYFSQ